jgi:hypothetical protein
MTPSASRPLAVPRAAGVEAGADGRPVALQGAEVMTIREEWVVEDRWWTGRRLRRRYFELVLEDGRCVVVFRDLVRRSWAIQAG